MSNDKTPKFKLNDDQMPHKKKKKSNRPTTPYSRHRKHELNFKNIDKGACIEQLEQLEDEDDWD